MYERFFGLADTPFRLTPDPRYLFLSPKHAEALAHLKLGLRESSGFVCITGDVGTGKTTLLRAFLAGLPPETATACICSPPRSALELLKTMTGELGLFAKTRSRKKLVDALNAHLLAQREAGRRSIVIIDEAQALSIDVLEQLRLLSNLETTTEKLLRIVLVGQPQLRALLLHPELVQLNQRITLRWHMGPLSRRETVAYMLHRLRVAAGGDPPPRIFTRPALRRTHRISRGVPRVVNMVAHRALMVAFAAERRLASLEARATTRVAVGAILAAWHAEPLAADEPVDLARIAARRHLEDLPLVGNGSMLRLLDLPAILELRVPGADQPRPVALTGMSDGRAELVVDGSPTPVDAAFLDHHWFGRAHVFWRDFEALGPAFGHESHGAPVARLQALLRRIGAYDGKESGQFDPPTEAALLGFQRARFLAVDGRVGRLTRIVLYAAAGGYPRPTLGAPS